MFLKGPALQLRLFGTEAAYRSADVDLLVPGRHAHVVRRRLQAGGWRFSAANGLLWRLDRAAAFERDGVVIDLHWGLHVAIVPPWLLRSLERDLWAGASRSAQGWLEPRIEPLLVYLAVRAAGQAFVKPESVRCVAAAMQRVEDWDEVDAIARRARVTDSVRRALACARGEAHERTGPLLDHRWGRAQVTVLRAARGGHLPHALRTWARRLWHRR